MEPATFLGLAAVVAYATLAALGILARRSHTRHEIGRREGRWGEAARAAGLAAVEEREGSLAGWAGPLRVRLEHFAEAATRGTRITVSGPAMPAGLTIRPEGVGTTLRGWRGVREVEIGHDAFDAATWIEGDPSLARAVLDAETRRTLRGLFDGRLGRPGRTPFWASGRLEDGALRVDVPELGPAAGQLDADARSRGEDPGAAVYIRALDHLDEVLGEVLALARRLARPADLASRLADNLRAEPVAGVRRRALAALAREFPDHPATREALLAAREDPDAEVRVEAGIALGPEGREALLGVAGGEGADDATTERAVAALGYHLTTEKAATILRRALRTRREATARACLAALGRRRGSEAIATLGKVLAVEGPALAAAAAEALGDTADPAAEPPLAAALGGADAEVRMAAARALGRAGTTAAVAALKALEASDPLARAAARQAIAEIQARAKGAGPGQLSLAGTEAGALSLPEGEPGRLSLASSPRNDPPASAAGEGE